jgi:hypothetical protein
VTAGTRTFEWTYSKDGSESIDDDTAWIDDIVFPVDSGPELPPPSLGSDPFIASNPSPADGAIFEDTHVSLSWSAGSAAISHDVFFSENLADVETGALGAFQGNQVSTFFIVGIPGFPYSDGLVPGTTYCWRIDEINHTDSNSPWKGDVWSFTVPSR